MFESLVGLRVSLTRQCCGMGSGGGADALGAGAARPAPGCAGATKTPAGTTSAAITVTFGVERVFSPSHVGVEAASSASVSVSMVSPLHCDCRAEHTSGGARGQAGYGPFVALPIPRSAP